MNSLLKNNERFTSIPIMKYVLNNELSNVEKIISENNNIVKFVHKKSGDSPLMLAARYKRFELVKLLVERGADKEHKNLDGKRVLHEASLSGCSQCIEYLLQQGCSVDVLKKADWTPLMLASTQGHLNVVKILVEFGANISRVNKDGWTSFHIACREGFVSLLEYLLKVDKLAWKTSSKNLRTPLHTAAMHGRTDVVKFLLNHCCYKANEKDSCGTSPLMDALKFGFPDISCILIHENLGDLQQCDVLGRFAIHIAVHSGQLNSVKYLMEECNVDVNLCCHGDSNTTRSIHLAAKENHVDVLEYIISHGALVNSVDSNKRTPLHLSVAADHIHVVQILLSKYSADCTVLDVSGKTALEYALSDEVKMCFNVMT